ncbi:MAG: glycosyltransferase family 4 protein [Chloroflexi bacterium]|nr:glycosyltransferase family 4 protein [Chloroflexota bacterium]
MRILYLSQYFPPEVGATQTRAYEMARHLVQAGHQVTMLTEFPNHPSGIMPDEFRGKWCQRESLEGIDVLRIWVKASPVKSFRNRMLFYLSYMLNATLVGLLKAQGPYDLVYVTSPPLFVGGAGLALSALKRAKLVFEVRDLWPESAVALGELSNRQAIAWASRLEELCYNRASRIVVVTNGIEARLQERGYGAKLALIANGSNTELFRPSPEAGLKLRQELGLGSRFVVLYAGIHGLAQGMETLVEAARLLQDQPDVHFLFVGEGPKKMDAAILREEYGLQNLTMLSERPMSEMPAFLSAANVALVPLRKHALFQGALPSKMFDAWACGCPIILSIEGEARRVLEAAQGGLYAEPEDAASIAAAVQSLRARPAEAAEMGLNGRRYVEAHYSRQRMAQRLEELLREIV